ncbi:MAG: Holliday junction branch migration protein RuvA [Bacteroidales bacterium]|nr:Holliday junction branch migration protein RuvA [Candidatus Liminaster caballi]
MIEYLNGMVTELDPTQAIVECSGVGYCCNISVYTYDKLRRGEVQKIYIAESIREDAHVLYGFVSKQERALFNLLISVSGVGPGTARCILSSLSPDELVALVASGNDRQLRNVKGLGPKTAQRIIVDLKDKVGSLGITAATAGNSPIMASNQNADEAIQALVALGYPAANANKAITQLLSKDPSMSVQALIKAGLHMM